MERTLPAAGFLYWVGASTVAYLALRASFSLFRAFQVWCVGNEAGVGPRLGEWAGEWTSAAPTWPSRREPASAARKRVQILRALAGSGGADLQPCGHEGKPFLTPWGLSRWNHPELAAGVRCLGCSAPWSVFNKVSHLAWKLACDMDEKHRLRIGGRGTGQWISEVLILRNLPLQLHGLGFFHVIYKVLWGRVGEGSEEFLLNYSGVPMSKKRCARKTASLHIVIGSTFCKSVEKKCFHKKWAEHGNLVLFAWQILKTRTKVLSEKLRKCWFGSTPFVSSILFDSLKNS